jgi:enoyl-CoA hydratase/carnithine racemase
MSVSYAVRDLVATVTIERPEVRNAMDPATLDELAAAWARAESDDGVRAVILTGAGTAAFSAGADLKADWSGAQPAHDAFFPERVLRKPLIAAVRGFCLAGGCELLLACDVRIASADATFGLPEPSRGLFPAGGSAVRAPRRLGWANAMHLLLTAERIDANAALRIGLINEIADDPLARAREIAARIARNSPASVRAIKECALQTDGMPLLDALVEQARFVKPGSVDAREGVDAWKEKRAPKF